LPGFDASAIETEPVNDVSTWPLPLTTDTFTVNCAPAVTVAGGWVVTANGEVVPVGSAPNYGSVTRLLAYGDRAVGIVTDRRSGGFWVTTRQGDIIPAGGAPAEPDAAACLDRPGAQPPFAGAVGDPDVDAPAPLWTYSVNGGICGFNPYR